MREKEETHNLTNISISDVQHGAEPLNEGRSRGSPGSDGDSASGVASGMGLDTSD